MMRSKALFLLSMAVFLSTPAATETDGSLAGAIRALEADSPAVALELSTEEQQNPWLEVYRLYLRADALSELADSASCIGAAVTALRIISDGAAGGHPAETDLLTLAVLCGGPGTIIPFLTDDNRTSLDPRSLLLLSRFYLASGDTAQAAISVRSAARRRPGKSEMNLLRELAEEGGLEIEGISPGTVASFASSAISAGEMETARLLTDIVSAPGEYEWLAELLHGDRLASSGRKTKALARYRSVFDSDIYPVEGKKEALRRLAALQYSMKRYRDASGSYRKFGLYYPDDPFAEISTDMSARIEVASGRWDSAVETWQRIADAGPKTFIGREAILGMAVILERAGREDEACRILLSNIKGVRGRLKSAYLYWIARTCGDAQIRSDNAGLLSRMFAGSFYSTALEHGPGFLNADSAGVSVASVARIEAETRTDPFPGTGTPPDHASLEAFRYFAGYGMKGRASECAIVYAGRLDSTARAVCLGTIYIEARKAGLEALCLKFAVDNTGLFAGRTDYIEYLYPFAYGTVIDRYSRERKLPAELVLAVIREESRFDETVMSPAGAWGLMQIMPSTGEWIGGKLGRKDIAISDLLDPDFNVAAGCWYLRFLLDRADASVVGALAAYNAGHGRMRGWKKKFSPHDDPMAAMELIGPSETRQYVRRVLDSMSAYGNQNR